MKCMKWFIILILILLTVSLSLAGCYEGYVVNKDRNILIKYLNPEEIKNLSENPQDDIWIMLK